MRFYRVSGIFGISRIDIFHYPAVLLDKTLVVSAVVGIFPQVASAGFLNVPKQSLDLPIAGKVNTKGPTLGPSGFYVMCATIPSPSSR